MDLRVGRTPEAARRPRAFTLIELLVVVSIISLLIGILLPTLGNAVTQARSVVCGTTQRGLAQGMLFWSTENKDKIPGLNGTWVDARNRPNWQEYLDSNSAAPVQSTDWMSASLAGEDLPRNRAQRFIHLLNHYRCPEQSIAPAWTGGAAGTTEFREMLDRTAEDLYSPSYFMSAYFQWSGIEVDRQAGSFPNFSIIEYARDHESPVVIPSGYRFRVNQVGSPSRKAAIADGFRFREESGLVNTEVAYEAGFDYGSFAHSTPSYNNSAEYVRARSLSYRHGGKISAAYFDGHVGTMSEAESRDPTPWFPAGSLFNGEQAHDGAFEFYEAGATIN